MAPLHATAARASAATEWADVRMGLPAADWTVCADVDRAFVAAWEERIGASLVREYGRSHPTTVAAYLLDWYAGVPGGVGGAFFRLARRVPRLDRGSLAFTCEPDEHYPVGTALLDERFWCLPDDLDADHPAATAVVDEAALAGVLRSQVRAHADAFLGEVFLPGRRPVRLARRALLGAFFDGLDAGIWYGGDPADEEPVLTAAAAALPGGVEHFPDASTIHRLVDDRGRPHLSQRRIGCCHYYRVAESGIACSTCPRTSDAERVVRHGELD